MVIWAAWKIKQVSNIGLLGCYHEIGEPRTVSSEPRTVKEGIILYLVPRPES